MAAEGEAKRRRVPVWLETLILLAVALAQLGDQDIAEELLVIAQPAQPAGGIIEPLRIVEIDPDRGQPVTDFGQARAVFVNQIDYAGHPATPASWG